MQQELAVLIVRPEALQVVGFCLLETTQPLLGSLIVSSLILPPLVGSPAPPIGVLPIPALRLRGARTSALATRAPIDDTLRNIRAALTHQ